MPLASGSQRPTKRGIGFSSGAGGAAVVVGSGAIVTRTSGAAAATAAVASVDPGGESGAGASLRVHARVATAANKAANEITREMGAQRIDNHDRIESAA